MTRLLCCVALLVACSSRDDARQRVVGGAGTSAQGGGSVAGASGAGGAGGAGAGGGADAGESARDAGTALPRCTHRSQPECQVQTLGPSGREGQFLTVMGDDVYWFAYDPSVGGPVVTRTSLVDRASVDTPIPTDPVVSSAFQSIQGMANDGTTVYAQSAGANNPVLSWSRGDAGWAKGDLGLSVQADDQIVIANGIGYTRIDRFILTVDLTALVTLDRWATLYPEYPDDLATDGSELFIVVSDATDGTAKHVSRFDPQAAEATELGSLPAGLRSPVEELAVGESLLYLAADTQILSVPRAGGADATGVFDDAPRHPRNLLLDGDVLYFIDDDGVRALPLDGTAEAELIAEVPLPELRQMRQTPQELVWVGTQGVQTLRK